MLPHSREAILFYTRDREKKRRSAEAINKVNLEFHLIRRVRLHRERFFFRFPMLLKSLSKEKENKTETRRLKMGREFFGRKSFMKEKV